MRQDNFMLSNFVYVWRTQIVSVFWDLIFPLRTVCKYLNSQELLA